jgi:phosphonate ABC transporter permease subunit PhnE
VSSVPAPQLGSQPQRSALLSLLVPGLGQWALGRRQRGISLLLAVALAAALVAILGLSPLFLLAIVPLWALNVADAQRIATGRPAPTAWLVALGALPYYVIGWQVTRIDLERLIGGAGRVRPLVAGLFQPRVFEPGSWQLSQTALLVAGRMGETIAQALMASAVGALLAVPLAFVGARNLMAGNPLLRGLYVLSRAVMNVLRAVEPLIMAIVFVVWVGLGPFAGVLALTVHTVAALGKLYSEAIESIDPGPIEAIRSSGANQLQVIVYGVLPQVLPPWIAFTVYRWDINVRMSTVIGFVGGGGIGFLLAQWIRLQDFRSAGAAIWGIAIVVIALDALSARIRERVI